MTFTVSIPAEAMAISRSARSTPDYELALVERLESGRAALPVLPAVASAALDLANDPETTIEKFAQLVSGDPPIAARFLATANSAMYSRGLRISSLRDAVARVGISGARDLVLQVVYGSTLSGLKRFQEEVKCSFRASVLSAHLSRLAAAELQLSCADAYLCGLLHDIGESRVYRILSELGSAVDDREVSALVERYHTRAGAELADKWKLPPQIGEVCRKHNETRVPESVELRVVRVADVLRPAVEAELSGGTFELNAKALEPLEIGKMEAQAIIMAGVKLAKTN
jgi:putative nucleotidyltransferase with HDIG domain